MRLNKIALILRQAVLVVQLFVNLMYALAPVYVGGRGEVLEGDVLKLYSV